MGGYLSLTLQLDASVDLGLLAPLLELEFFAPATLVGVEAHQGGDHWFLAGRALEHPVGLFLARGAPPAASVTVAASEDPPTAGYLEMIAGLLARGETRPPPRSPFETVDRRLGITRLDHARLPAASLGELGRWQARFPNAVCYCYGSVALRCHGDPVPGAFRFLTPAAGGAEASIMPFLMLRLAPAAGAPEESDLAVTARSSVWLREGGALGGCVGPDEADHHLAGLAALAETLARAAPPGRTAELHLEGGGFQREADRLRAALAGLLGGSR
jgi:hypothetical protein